MDRAYNFQINLKLTPSGYVEVNDVFFVCEVKYTVCDTICIRNTQQTLNTSIYIHGNPLGQYNFPGTRGLQSTLCQGEWYGSGRRGQDSRQGCSDSE